jgi:hypothetical protein
MTCFAIYANQQELQHLPEDVQYLVCNYPWKHHPAYAHCMELVFPDTEDGQMEAYAVYHELWHFRHDLPSLQRSWI